MITTGSSGSTRDSAAASRDGSGSPEASSARERVPGWRSSRHSRIERSAGNRSVRRAPGSALSNAGIISRSMAR